MKRIKIIIVLCLTYIAGVHADNTFPMSFSDVVKRVQKQFNVKLKCGKDTVGKVLPYAEFRIRPYSLEETLDNICKYFDYNWLPQTDGSYKIVPYEAWRRKETDGKKMLEWLSSLYINKEEWEARRGVLRKELRERLEIDTYLDSLVKGGGEVILSKVRRYDGYTVQNICIETLPGEHVFGSIYAPAKYSKAPLIICPNGHFADGRYRKDQQQRLATLARMGAICVDYDLYAWGESALEHPSFIDATGKKVDAHRTDRAQVMQALNGLVLLDWMVKNRGKKIDMTRIGVNGGSGGGSQSVLFSALDERFTAAAPVVSLASHFDGGCPCESGKPTMLAGGGTCNAEIMAMFAPKPVLIVSDGKDWTSSVPTLEMPYLQRIWNFYEKKDALTNVHLPDEGHDFNISKRMAVYEFFIKFFHLDSTKLDEEKVTIEPAEMMKSRNDISLHWQKKIPSF